MALKFYLNKFLKVDNIEKYTLTQLMTLKDTYQNFIEESEGYDPDFPMSTFGDGKGKKIGGTNIYTIGETISRDLEEGDDNTMPPPPVDVTPRKDKSVNERALEFLKNVGMA